MVKLKKNKLLLAYHHGELSIYQPLQILALVTGNDGRSGILFLHLP